MQNRREARRHQQQDRSASPSDQTSNAPQSHTPALQASLHRTQARHQLVRDHTCLPFARRIVNRFFFTGVTSRTDQNSNKTTTVPYTNRKYSHG